ncbi:hypothetical protein LCGC14_2183570 [marine sediment metagenome]|uniref:DUF5659 domain-containing protein n=1 Tax=marine sediment metagenome TaxID=412755 RepID=A0A0F9DLK3_9ZZZZ
MNMKNEPFPTSDLPLATFLYAKGVLLQTILDSPDDPRRKVFVFNEPPQELLTSFQSGEASVSVLAFSNAQNALKTMLRSR